jgi:uncharacterized membrane protein
MVTTIDRTPRRGIHPLLAVLLACTIPLFLGGLFSDWAYSTNYQVQWANFASWLIAGAMVFTGLALLGSFIELIRGKRFGGWPLICCVILLAMFVLGLINCFVHARDAYGTMPGGLILSVIVTALAIVATWVGFSSLRSGVTK